MKRFVCVMVMMALVMVLAGSVVHAEVLPRHGEGQIGLQGVVLCEELTVRQDPSTSSKSVKKLHYGDFLIVVEQTDGWARIFLSDDVDEESAGWVNADYIAVDPEWYHTEGKTPVYAWDNAYAPKVALLDSDITLPILSNQGDWLIVSLRGAVGFIHLN